MPFRMTVCPGSTASVIWINKRLFSNIEYKPLCDYWRKIYIYKFCLNGMHWIIQGEWKENRCHFKRMIFLPDSVNIMYAKIKE